MNWRIKGLTQGLLSSAPGGGRLNDLLQRAAGGLRDFPAHLASKVGDWIGVVQNLSALGVRPAGARFMEIGTGWFPSLPICFSLCGAEVCTTFDLSRHLDPGLCRRMLLGLESHLDRIAAAGSCDNNTVHAAYDQMRRARSMEEMLAAARVDYRAPADAGESGLPTGSMDVVFSNSVLEHVPPGDIQRLMVEGCRVLRHGGIAIHGVNCGDHYAYFDRRITAINYLTYSSRQWQRWNNRLLYQNRLRPHDFIEMAEQAGLRMVQRIQRPREELLNALPEMEIAEEFAGYPPEELCCTSLDFACQKA